MGYITVDSNASDPKNLTLWHAGETLIATAVNTCANTIVVPHPAGPVIMEQEFGNSIVDVLFGIVNPSARLPYTIAMNPSDSPASMLYMSSDPTSQITYYEY